MSRISFLVIVLAGMCLALPGFVGAVEQGERVEIMFGRGTPTDTSSQGENPVPVDPWQPPKGGFSIESRPPGSVVCLPSARLAFSKNTCNIARSLVLGTPLGDRGYPNLLVKIGDVTYSQNNSKVGKLQAIDDGDFQIIKGTFHLTSDDGKVAFPWSVEYKICKENSYTVVTYSDPSPVGTQKAKGSYFSIDHEFTDVERHCLNELALGCSMYNAETKEWIGWSNLLMTDEDKVYADKHLLNAVLIANGRIGIASEPPTLNKVFDIEPGRSGFLRVDSTPGMRRFSWVIVNHSDATMRPFPPQVCYALAYYPPKEYRHPKMRFASIWSSGRQMALLGSDLTEYTCGGGNHTPEEVRDIHSYGGQDMLMAPNWAGASAPDYKNDKEGQQFVFGRPQTYSPCEDSRILCWRAPTFVNEFWHYLMTDVVAKWDLDGSRIDCNTPNWCNNTAHGCDAGHTFYGPNMFEQMRLLRRRYDEMSKNDGKQYLIGAAHNLYPSVNAYLDYSISGEGNADYPSEVVADLYFNSLLYGRDFGLLAVGNSPVNITSPRIYEQMLERCGTVLSIHFAMANVDHHAIAIWRKYHNPLYIFGASGSELHHPFHYDYPDFAGERDPDVLKLVYSRPGRALVTLCNRSSGRTCGPLNLNLKNLGIGGKTALLYDVRSNTVDAVHVSPDGWLKTTTAYPERYDVRFIQVSALSQVPTVIWNSATTRAISEKWDGKKLDVTASGPRDVPSRLYIYCPGGRVPDTVTGGSLHSFISSEGLCLVDFEYGSTGSSQLAITFNTKKRPSRPEDDIDKLRCEFAILKEKVEDSNFTRVDSYAMKGLYAKLRNCASVIVGRNERSKLMEDINDAENLLFSFEEIVNCKEKSRGAPRYLCNNVDLVTDYIKSSGAIETEWALIGPFRNEGFDKVYPCEKSTDFSASYAGKDGQEIRWQKARGYFLQLHRFAGWSTRDPVGAPRKDMICFARTTVTSPDDREGTLVFRVDGRARIWLNGSEIGEGYSYSDASTPIPSETRIPIKLKKGPNDLQVKLESGGEDTAFFPVLKDSQDKTMQDITTSTDAPVIGSVFAHNLYLNVVDALGGQPKN